MATISNGDREVEIPDGTDLIDDHVQDTLAELGIEFVCGTGGYGCCRVKVLSGMENLEPTNIYGHLGGNSEEAVGEGFILPCCAKLKCGRLEVDSSPIYRHFGERRYV